MNTIFCQVSSFIFISFLSSVALVIYLWLHTDFFAYYLKLAKPILSEKIYCWLMAEDFFNFSDENLEFDSYIEYLSFQKQGVSCFTVQFILKLISCKTCLTTWVSILISLLCCGIHAAGPIFLFIIINIFLLRFFLKTS